MSVNIDDRKNLIMASVRSLQRHLGAGVVASLEATAGPREADTLIRLRFAAGRELTACVEARRSLRPAHIPQLQEQLRERCEQHACDRAVVVSPYIPRPLAERLREMGIWFADAGGNAYLEIPGEILVHVSGERPPAAELAAPPWPSAAAARVFFGLLVRGPEVKVTYRDLAGDLEVSLGLVSRAITALVSEGILRRRGQAAYQVARPPELVDLWCEGYERRLRPKLFRGRFHAPSGSDFTPIIHAVATDNELQATVLGGELAADLLAGHLRASSATLYVPQGKVDTVRVGLKLAPSTDGSIEVYASFARDLGARPRRGGPRLAHPALVYAELLATGDPRCEEAAVHLMERFLPWAM